MSITKLWVFSAFLPKFGIILDLRGTQTETHPVRIEYRSSALHTTPYLCPSPFDVSASVVSIRRVRVKGHNSQKNLDRFQVWQLLPSIFRILVKIIAKILYRWNSFIYLKGLSVWTKESEISFQLTFKRNDILIMTQDIVFALF